MAGVFVAVCVLVATAAFFLRGDRGDISPELRVSWQPTGQHFLSAPMRSRPIPGWRLRLGDLGLPEGSQLSTTDMPIHSRSLIGNVGDRAYFLARTLGEPTQWWLAGVDVSRGSSLFPAVKLNKGWSPRCVLNGPDALLCVTSEVSDRTALVIDSHSGAVTFDGSTDLDVRPNDLNVEQVGIYAVAESVDEGVYGIGPTAKTTWFVPGAGDIRPTYLGGVDIDPPAMAYQTTSGRGSFGKVVFSLLDGRVLRPQVPRGAEQQDTLLFPGGFASRIETSDGQDHIELFDANGNRATPRTFTGGWPQLLQYFDVPVVSSPVHGDSWALVTPTGGLVFSAPTGSGEPVRLVGSRLIISASEFSTRGWAQYNVQTGTWGKRCTNLDMDGGYIGSDGRIAVTSDGNPTIGLDTEATDLDTCERLWVISSAPGSWRDVWRINNTLVQLSDNGTELMSLVAP
ncbi:hypothetical protein FK535_01250 [Mycolicibacterium sp. 018/SC-01/001]|uniref:hypothetical protein n=1 Tax=Mycolicibacterium sp. 018/SC-01/001 TaxID=2592069 RepID=UPI001180FC41|nr:hypothetical protein [Mycolicibacterium sp. 018/SC-01/001]TRW88931.1 hypothetical protein FK535_01250 [Mycolicibacterium sp. 018/SC-01/001]